MQYGEYTCVFALLILARLEDGITHIPRAEMAEPALQTIHGRPCQLVHGFTMMFHRYKSDGVQADWRCVKASTKGVLCPARGKSASPSGPITMTSGASAATRHNHPIDIVSPEVTYFLYC